VQSGKVPPCCCRAGDVLLLLLLLLVCLGCVAAASGDGHLPKGGRRVGIGKVPQWLGR